MSLCAICATFTVMADNSLHPDNRLIDAMLSHVAEQGWRGLTVADVAARADIPVETAEALCRNRTDLLDMFACRVDATSIVDVGPVPDDPGALLKRKFALEHRRRVLEGEQQ